MKYLGVDIPEMLQHCVNDYTVAYKDDVKLDIEQLSKTNNQIYIWLLRRHGTYLFPMIDCFVKGHKSRECIQYYAELESDSTVAYIVEQTFGRMGNVYEIALMDLYREIKRLAVDTGEDDWKASLYSNIEAFKRRYRKGREGTLSAQYRKLKKLRDGYGK